MHKRNWAVVVLIALLCAALFVILNQSATEYALVAEPAQSDAAPGATLAYDPVAVPAGTYVVDPHHAALTGKIRHAGLSHFAFRFRRFDARFTYDPERPESPNVEVFIDPSSIDTNVDGFDTNMATSERHFNVSTFPEIKFVSNSLKRTGEDTGVLEGELTFLGVSKPLNMDVVLLGTREGRRGTSVGFSASTTFLRSDFGFADGSGNLADEVAISVEADFLPEPQ
jgi:polyisoprenoid-binding protein YceI